MRTETYLKTASEIQADVEARLNDGGNTLATDAQYVLAINDTLRLWSKRVLVPHLYEFSFSGGVREYALPRYVRPPFIVQIRTNIFAFGISTGDDSATTFIDFANFQVEPDGTGGYKLRMQTPPYSEDGRIIWFAENGPVVATGPTLTSTIAADATSAALTVSSSPEFNDSGFVKIESEWLSYRGITRTSATSYTLLNLVHGLFGTVAASHNSTTAVAWGVAVDDQRLWTHMYDQVAAYAHLYNLHKSTTEDLGRHEKLYSAFQARADSFWQREGYVSQRPGRRILHHSAWPGIG